MLAAEISASETTRMDSMSTDGMRLWAVKISVVILSLQTALSR